eukprot:gene4689-6586_t
MFSIRRIFRTNNKLFEANGFIPSFQHLKSFANAANPDPAPMKKRGKVFKDDKPVKVAKPVKSKKVKIKAFVGNVEVDSDVNVITKTEMIKIVHDQVPEVSKKDVETILNTTISSILREVVEKEKTVQFHGFGAFKPKILLARKARNPSNGEVVEAAGTKRISFNSSKKTIVVLDK